MTTDRIALLKQTMKDRVVLMDGAMGTMLQRHKFSEEDFRGSKFSEWSQPLQGNNDVLNLTQPAAVKTVHLEYFLAGADIAETNTFASTSIAQADYGLEDYVQELNVSGAQLANEAAREAEAQDGTPRFVAGALGPTNRTASISPNVNDPGYRAVTFDELKDSYGAQVRGLLDGGVDMFLLETVFDTLNAKAAVFAIEEIGDELGRELPVMISGTISDMSGRVLSGQTPEAFWNSLRHVQPLAFGLNCGLGAAEMRDYVAMLSRVADVPIIAYPNAGLPNEFGEYDQPPEETGALLGDFAQSGFANILGGCCGTTPEHIRAIADSVRGKSPRAIPKHSH